MHLHVRVGCLRADRYETDVQDEPTAQMTSVQQVSGFSECARIERGDLEAARSTSGFVAHKFQCVKILGHVQTSMFRRSKIRPCAVVRLSHFLKRNWHQHVVCRFLLQSSIQQLKGTHIVYHISHVMYHILTNYMLPIIYYVLQLHVI